ncbi:hypothetical protein [Streptomyces dysideae]|uniref:Uncharacterized protein n=1 Tax=Streptomyces dysideae TaxID=909626 RepID=A0A101V277_9ACTN|nr:hypothetical protein [Streptomyces dysideae]KUO21160.1 hypothetical protein AQJ91_11015 [Streptomyces dysideae]
MTQEAEHSGPASGGGGDQQSGEAAAADRTAAGAAGEESEERDQPQNAWAAQRDLIDHSPRTMRIGSRARFGGSYFGGDQNIGGDQHNVTGDVFMGGKTEIHQWSLAGHSLSAATSGEVPQRHLDRLADSFVADEETVENLLVRLRRDRVLVLSGARFTGRHTAALMLLRRLGATPVHILDRDSATPSALADGITAPADSQNSESQVRGYVLCDLATRRGSPLREPHLLAARSRLAEQDAYLVVTVGLTAVLEDVPCVVWQPPAAAEVLAAHLRTHTGEETAAELLELPAVAEFLGRSHQLREIASFADRLGKYAAGEATEDDVTGFSRESLENQVQEWFEEDEASIHLRDKAFLVALAAFDGGPYALTAELSDLLFRFLLKTENSARVPEVPVFGTHIGKRLQLARAEKYEDEEHTEWGPVTQQKARFVDERAPLVLLREVWTGHPSARPALVEWLRRLADDGRPLVRTRAASTVAVLARTDLPSAMALVIEPWATSNLFRHRLVAVNSLTLAHVIGTPNVPRILDGWSQSEDRRLRWVAARAYALIGPELPEQALAALRDAARRLYDDLDDPDDFDLEMVRELSAAVALLLLSPAHDQVLAELRRHLDDDLAVHSLTLGGFISACRRQEEENDRASRPLVLTWYADAATGGQEAAHGIPFLWRAVLGDRDTTGSALDVLADWVLIADRSEATEWALAALLPQLVTTPTEYQRLSHLLRTMPGADGAPRPRVADRLLTTLPPR